MAESKHDQVLVLKRTKLGETDLILTLLDTFGVQYSAVAKGGRKPSSKTAGLSAVGAELNILLSVTKGLPIIREAASVNMHKGCHSDLEHSMTTDAICDTARVLSAEGMGERVLYAMTSAALDVGANSRVSRLPLLVSAFVLKAVSTVGYKPELHGCVLGGEKDQGQSLYLSAEEGGLICTVCANKVKDCRHLAPGMSGWLRTLMNLTFLQLTNEDFKVDEEELNKLGMDLGSILMYWISAHPGVRPPALEFMMGTL